MTTTSETSSDSAELDALIALALGEHRAGRLVEAAEAYRKVLALRPDIAEAHNNLGDVLLSQGRVDEAVAEYEQALALKPDFAEAHNNLGFAFGRQGRLDEAAAQYRHAVALNSELFQAHNNLGNVLREQGKLDQAVAAYQQAVAKKPDFADAHFNLGNALASQGRLGEAEVHFQQVVALRPDHADGHYNLGVVSEWQGKLDQAAAQYEQAVALRPDYAEAHNNLGNVLLKQGEFDEAAARYRQVIALRPSHAVAYNNLGNVLRDQGQLDEAAAQYSQAIALGPDFAEAHNNLGAVRSVQGKLDEAAAQYEQAIALKPELADPHYNLGNVLLDQGKIDAAAACYQQALTLRPDYGDAQMGLATCYLVEGDFERGWPAFEGRLRIPGFVAQPNIPRWSGEPLAGRSLLLVAEQGLGDTIHFVRYARLLKQRGARVVLAAQKPLGKLLALDADLDELCVLGAGEELPRCDFYLPLMSAPAALGTTAATIPANVPYLAADPALIAKWRRELAPAGGFKIAIAWQGSRDFRLDRQRSIPLAQFAPLAKVPGVRLISLQKGFGSEQVAMVDFPVLDLSERLDEVAGPFMDTAAVIRNVDLVVTANTAIAHLAGALGVPVWLALQLSRDWRWLNGRDDSPWYPTMRIFRQTPSGGWPEVFRRMAKAVPARHSETEDHLL